MQNLEDFCCPDLVNEFSLQMTEHKSIIRLTRNLLVFPPSVLTEQSHFLQLNIKDKEANFLLLIKCCF